MEVVTLTAAEVQALLTEHTYLTRVLFAASQLAADRKDEQRHEDLVQCLRDALDFYSSRSGA